MRLALALVFAGLALAQSAPSWSYFPMNAKDSGFVFYTKNAESPVSVVIVLKDKVLTQAFDRSVVVDRFGTAFFPVDRETMRKVLTGTCIVVRIEVNGEPVDYPKAGREYR